MGARHYATVTAEHAAGVLQRREVSIDRAIVACQQQVRLRSKGHTDWECVWGWGCGCGRVWVWVWVWVWVCGCVPKQAKAFSNALLLKAYIQNLELRSKTCQASRRGCMPDVADYTVLAGSLRYVSSEHVCPGGWRNQLRCVNSERVFLGGCRKEVLL